MSDLTDITDNIESVLSSTLGYNLEDLSDVDQLTSSDSYADWNDEVLCQLFFTGIERIDTMGEAPKRSYANFEVKIVFRDNSPANSRERAQDIHDSMWSNMITTNIDLDAQNVEHTEHLESTVEYNPPITTIYYPLRVRYGYTS